MWSSLFTSERQGRPPSYEGGLPFVMRTKIHRERFYRLSGGMMNGEATEADVEDGGRGDPPQGGRLLQRRHHLRAGHLRIDVLSLDWWNQEKL